MIIEDMLKNENTRKVAICAVEVVTTAVAFGAAIIGLSMSLKVGRSVIDKVQDTIDDIVEHNKKEAMMSDLPPAISHQWCTDDGKHEDHEEDNPAE